MIITYSGNNLTSEEMTERRNGNGEDVCRDQRGNREMEVRFSGPSLQVASLHNWS